MSVRRRIEKYRSSGGAADLVKVEVLVPSSARDDVLRLAARLRSDHRDNKELARLCDHALSLYSARVLNNVDLDRLPDLRARAGVIARALMELGDARAFVLGREIIAQTASPLHVPPMTKNDLHLADGDLTLAAALAQSGDADFDFEPPQANGIAKPADVD